MKTTPTVVSNRLEFTFTGVLALSVANTKDHFDIGVIKGASRIGDIPNHTALIEIKEGGSVVKRFKKDDMQKEMYLEIGGRTTSNTQLFRPGLNFARNPANDDLGHFDWIVDIEGRELHDGWVSINPQFLWSVLRVSRIDGGVFFTDKVSEGPLHVIDDVRSWQLDRVGEIIKALIPLPAEGATLRNGINDPNPFIFDGGKSYQITISQHCNPGACDDFDTSDFYNALFGSTRPDGKIRFFDPKNTAAKHAMIKGATTPDTGCPVVNFSLTPNLPTPAL